MNIQRTAARVEEHTDEMVNARIHRQTEANVAYYARRLDEIEQRLDELDREWDIERAIETNAATLMLFGLGLGIFWKKALVLPMVVGSFLLQHAIQGWCPPVPVFRRMGVRTQREINQERYALKALRGDFEAVGNNDAQDEDSLDRAAKAVNASALH